MPLSLTHRDSRVEFTPTGGDGCVVGSQSADLFKRLAPDDILQVVSRNYDPETAARFKTWVLHSRDIAHTCSPEVFDQISNGIYDDDDFAEYLDLMSYVFALPADPKLLGYYLMLVRSMMPWCDTVGRPNSMSQARNFNQNGLEILEDRFKGLDVMPALAVGFAETLNAGNDIRRQPFFVMFTLVGGIGNEGADAMIARAIQL